MRTMIYCKSTSKGVHSFYLVTQGEEFYLFSQSFRRGVHNYFSRGVDLGKAFCSSNAHNDSALLKTMDKLPRYIKYIEKEYEIAVFDRSKKTKITRERKREIEYADVSWAC